MDYTKGDVPLRIRLVVLGILGVSLVIFALTSCFYAYINKKDYKAKTFYTLMITLTIIGSLLFSYPCSIYLKNKRNIPGKELAIQFDGKIVTTQANAKERLFLPMAYDTIEATHPSVVSFEKKWHGYSYWMAVTAYPKGDATKENPHILASNDLTQWVEPKSGLNPLDEPHSSKNDEHNRPLQYDSDTHLIFNKEKQRLEIFWRYVDDVRNKVTIYRQTTSDGQDWSNKEIIYKENRKPNDWISPAFVKDESGYKVWYVTRGFNIVYRDSLDGKKWKHVKKLSIPYDVKRPDEMRHWHLDVQKIDGKYEMMVVGFRKKSDNTLKDRHTMSLYHSTSVNGKDWEPLKAILHPSGIKTAWDGKGLYRSSFIKENGNYYIFYSGIGYDQTRGIGLSYGDDLDNLQGVDFSHLEQLHN